MSVQSNLPDNHLSLSTPTLFGEGLNLTQHTFETVPADFGVHTHVGSKRLNLNHYLMPNPTATFLMRASMETCVCPTIGLHSRDLLIVDRSLPLTLGSWVVLEWQGGLALKQVTWYNRQYALVSLDEPVGPPLPIQRCPNVLWGVVTHTIHHRVSSNLIDPF